MLLSLFIDRKMIRNRAKIVKSFVFWRTFGFIMRQNVIKLKVLAHFQRDNSIFFRIFAP